MITPGLADECMPTTSVTGFRSTTEGIPMSYSFSINAASRAAAKAEVTLQLARVVATQPAHAAETPGVRAAAQEFIDTLEEGPVNITISGAVSTTDWNRPDAPLTHAQASISCSKALG